MSYFVGSFRITGNAVSDVSMTASTISDCSIDMGGRSITNVGLPLDSQDAANKRYVDSLFGQTMYVFSVVLVGTTKTTFANLPVPGAYTIMVSAVDVDGPVACFVVTKNNIERHGLVNTLAHIKSSSGDALGLTWRANEGLALSKSGLTYDGTYRVKIL